MNKHSGGRLSSGLLVACQGASFWGQTLIVATELTSGAERPSPDAGGAVAASPRGLEGRAKRRPLVPVATGTRPPARPSLVTGQGWAASVLVLATVWTFPCLRSLSLWLGCAHGVLSPSGPRESLSQSLQPSLLGRAGPRPHVLLRPGVMGRERRRSEEWTRAAETAGPLPPLSGKRRRGQGRPFHALPLSVSGHSPNCTAVRWGGGAVYLILWSRLAARGTLVLSAVDRRGASGRTDSRPLQGPLLLRSRCGIHSGLCLPLGSLSFLS